MSEIFISYAWKDPDESAYGSREEFVERLTLVAAGTTVRGLAGKV